MKPTIDIIIPSFNGKYLLEKHLPEIIENSDYLNKIIIIDNGSIDGTVEWLNKNYPAIVVIKNKVNLGFTKPINQGVAVSKADFLVLLNNDVRPTKGYLKASLRFFEDSKVFAVSFNENKSSWPQVIWRDGKLQFSQGEDKTSPRFSTWASGGSAIFKRSLWNLVGGFNEVYAPYYYEDIDIGFRAWKMGYKIIWDNGSVVFHEHESTTKKINPSFVNLIKQRNELLFTWINITDRELRRSHFMFLITHSLRHLGYLKVILYALIRLLSNRQKLCLSVSDREVLSRVNQKYEPN
jgi:O-antigen biosynthesis protein